MKLGVLGAGNMGGALICGFAEDWQGRDPILVFDLDAEKVASVAAQAGGVVCAAESLEALVRDSDCVLIALKPNAFDTVVPQIAAAAAAAGGGQRVVVSIAAGISIAWLQGILGADSKVVRAMPNTPAMVGAGMSALARSGSVTDAEFAAVIRLFASVGRALAVDEGDMDAVIGISGSSPAYAYMFLQALIEAGVAHGLDAGTARELAAQATLGAAMMLQGTETDPEQLRINVCSPGGTTIEAVQVLEARGFMDIVKEAVDACVAKAGKMTR
ncbi:MAG: pyrroline-5-carboxylate reductase [Clostridiales Family XIII bacterium]|jgi:pyrroline-5-carboxylate reductase|nr:pyrroline-5-carboxylate reductase [Clostridiales Family XIII bacterium]